MNPLLQGAAVLLMAPSIAAAQGAPSFDWSGFYAGVHAGTGLSLVDVEDPFGASYFGDMVRATGFLAGGQLGYNWQFGSTVLGVEADASWADLRGTGTCFAYSGFYISSNCRSETDALGTLTGRLGWTLPSDDRTLLYGKGGLAWEHIETAAKANRRTDGMQTSDSTVRWGWTLGAGVEHALNSRWSLKAEYDYLNFGSYGFDAPESLYQTVAGNPGTFITVPQTPTQISQDVHLLKFGMNYRFGGDDQSPDPAWEWGTPDGATPPPPGTEIEVGVRYVRGWGRFQKDQERSFSDPNALESRLTYKGMTTNGAELFARLDAPFNLMIKGVLGTGQGSNGHINDEDWAIDHGGTLIPNSNTWSAASYKIPYAIIDVGYDVWRDGRTTVAPFVGYNYFKQEMEAFGCYQLANPNADCYATTYPTSRLVNTDTDTWHALRLGAAIDTYLTPSLKLSGDIAYLPYVKVDAVNHHVLKSVISPEWGHGTGAQLEAILSYAMTEQISVGVGGRYWSMWTTSGATNKGTILPMRFSAEQAALLLQASYRFGTQSDELP